VAFETVCRQQNGDLFGFGFVVVHAHHLDRIAKAMLRPQCLVEQFRIVRNHRVGGLQDTGAGTVILFQLDQMQIRKIDLQRFQVFDGGAAPCVNRLVIVTHRRKHRFLANPRHQQFDQFILAGIGVLIFIDQQIAQLALPAVAHFFIVAEQFYR